MNRDGLAVSEFEAKRLSGEANYPPADEWNSRSGVGRICSDRSVADLYRHRLMDFGLLVFQQMEVQQAAQAGAQYVITSMASANGYSSSDVSSAVTNATTFTQISASPSPFQFCGCPSSSGVQQPKSCSQANCTTGTLGTYVTVSAQAAYSPIVIGSIFTQANRTLPHLQRCASNETDTIMVRSRARPWSNLP